MRNQARQTAADLRWERRQAGTGVKEKEEENGGRRRDAEFENPPRVNGRHADTYAVLHCERSHVRTGARTVAANTLPIFLLASRHFI